MSKLSFKIFFTAFILILCKINSFAQEYDIDLKTLKSEIKSAKTDSIRINKLLDLSRYYYEHEINLDSMILISTQAANLSKKHKYLIETSKSYENLGRGYLLKNDLDSAYYYSNESHQIAKQLRDSNLEFSALIGLSHYFLKINNLVKATELGLEALKIAEQSNDKSQMATAYYKLAYTFAFHDDNDKHKFYLDKAFDIIESETIDVPTNIKSGIYASMVDYFEQKRFRNPENKFLKDTVLYYAEKGIAYGKSVNRASLLAYLLGAKGKMFFLENKTNQAKAYYNEALEFKEKIDQTNILNLYNKLAYVYLKENNIKEALSYKDSILKDIADEASFYKQGERYNLAYYICKTANKYDLALQYHEQMVKMFNKAKDEKQIKTLNELEVKYESQKKDSEIIAQQLENETIKSKARTNYFILSIIALLGIGVLAFLYFKRQNKILVSELNLTKTKEALHRSQLNPHFVSNSINAIYPFLYDKSDPNKAAAYLSDLSQMIRSILDSTFDTSWTLQEELNFIKQYCKIQELKMDVPLSLNLKFDGSLKHILIPSLVTQTFIENCFVHGFATQNIPASINIDVAKQEKELQIRITDNGTATINKSKNENHISRSNQIVEQRLKNTYPKSTLPKDFLTYGIINNTYQVVIKLPITT